MLLRLPGEHAQRVMPSSGLPDPGMSIQDHSAVVSRAYQISRS